jgi:hypothetical protein
MHLFKVIVSAKKQWMESYIDMAFATVADTSDGAIQQVIDEYDLDGVIIQKVKAEVVKNGVLTIEIKEYF